jgi:hypothetical protein
MKLLELTQGQYAKLDDQDYDWAQQWSWSAAWIDGRFYAMRSERHPVPKKYYLHRELLGLKLPTVFCDHANHDTLDDRRCNLRPCSPSHSSCNRRKTSLNKSGYKGVCWNKAIQKWVVQIALYGKKRYLGSYHDPAVAHQAYCKAAATLHQEYACTA